MKNFKQLCTFDYKAVLPEIVNSPFWNWLQLRSKTVEHNVIDDIILRFNSVQKVQTVDRFYNDLLCVDYFVQQYFPITMKIINEIFNDRILGRIVIAKLKPHGDIKAHVDEGEYAKAYDRYHLVVTTNDGVLLTSGNETLHLPQGTVWWFNNLDNHDVVNYGHTDRIHIVVDVLKEQ